MSRYDELLALATEAQTLWAQLAQSRRCSHALEMRARRRFERRADALDAYEVDRRIEADVDYIYDSEDAP